MTNTHKGLSKIGKNYPWQSLMSLAILFVLVFIPGCKSTSTLSHNTKIPYSIVNRDLLFWAGNENPLYAGFTHSISIEGRADIYLEHTNGITRRLTQTNDSYYGTFDFPKMAVTDAKNWCLRISLPEEKVRITPIVDIAIKTKTITYQELFSILEDFNQWQRETSTLPTWLQSKYHSFLFTFVHKSTISYMYDGRVTLITSAPAKTAVLKLNHNYLQENGKIVFSTLPDSILPLN